MSIRPHQAAVDSIRAAMANGNPVLLIGTSEAQAIAAEVGLLWVHELPDGEPLPTAVAWDMDVGAVMPPVRPGGVVVFGPGTPAWERRTQGI